MRPGVRLHSTGELLTRGWTVERFLGAVALAAALVIAGPPWSLEFAQLGPDCYASSGSHRQGEMKAGRHGCADAAGHPLIFATSAQPSGCATSELREGK